MKTWLIRSLLMLALTLCVALGAWAGQSCEEAPLTPPEVEQGLQLALQTAKALDASAAKVVLLARAGQDLGKYGLHWSHLGFAYLETPAAESPAGIGVWRVVHKLNACGSDQGGLFRQGLGEFFLDRPYQYRAAFAPLREDLQAALLPLLQDNRAVTRLQQTRYNMVAYAWGLHYQQSNQWATEVLASVAAPAAQQPLDRAQALAWLQAQGLQPTVLHIPTLTRLGARISRANIAFDDHPLGSRLAGQIATVTVDGIFDWLPRAGLGQNAVLIPTTAESDPR
ncbi:DUF2145 domain-containing protein [Paucibacter sp. KBW04]|uniref:DUF2145 domain-containing protein n=1 Tax=Paucibacter sp. KBW04 TaxID=2153361 RepID=UPI000F58B551|nr:DUF2145 domain-containing protein [Paucibacter sp. KBW04]RQO59870.1 DUF2145 domain-containing protein [Paucibacter sp. KBW04]